MKVLSLPKTRAGRWAAGLLAAFVALAILGGVISARIGNTIEYPNPINSPLLGSVIYLMFGAVIAAAAMGLIAVIRDKERSILVFAAIPIGVFFFVGAAALLVASLFER